MFFNVPCVCVGEDFRCVDLMLLIQGPGGTCKHVNWDYGLGRSKTYLLQSVCVFGYVCVRLFGVCVRVRVCEFHRIRGSRNLTTCRIALQPNRETLLSLLTYFCPKLNLSPGAGGGVIRPGVDGICDFKTLPAWTMAKWVARTRGQLQKLQA